MIVSVSWFTGGIVSFSLSVWVFLLRSTESIKDNFIEIEHPDHIVTVVNKYKLLLKRLRK